MKKFGFKGSPAVATSGTEPFQLLNTGHQHGAGGTVGYRHLAPSNNKTPSCLEPVMMLNSPSDLTAASLVHEILAVHSTGTGPGADPTPQTDNKKH